MEPENASWPEVRAWRKAQRAELVTLRESTSEETRQRWNEAMTQHLSIATFRYVPRDLRSSAGTPETESYLQRLNEELLTRLERSGEAFLSSAMVDGRFALRACIVNFRTSRADIDAMPSLIARHGQDADRVMRQ